MRVILTKLLFRLLEDRLYQDIDDVRINKWLVDQYKLRGFRDYFRKRDLQHLKIMGTGLSQENYQMRVGQRLELLSLLNMVNRAYKQSERELSKTILKKELLKKEFSKVVKKAKKK